MEKEKAGFEELEHTADWALRVWALDLQSLFEEAAHGMIRLMGIEWVDRPETRKEITVKGDDEETLLVNFLAEILYLVEDDNWCSTQYTIHLENHQVTAHLEGAPVKNQQKEIKAVTYHNLQIEKRDDVYEVVIVFDV